MLNSIIQYSLNNRLVIIILALLISGTGVYIGKDMEIDVFPDLTAPTVVVITEAKGMAPEEVEKLVTFPIETAVNGATDIRRIRSSSAMGFSLVWVEFEWGKDIYNARQIVSEKLASIADQLPEGSGSPVLAPQSSLLGEIMIFAITADSTSPMQLRTTAEWTIRPALLALGGVAQVTITGGDFKEFQILADPLKMKNHGVSFDELILVSKSSNENASGGFINDFGSEYIITGVARSNVPEEIGNSLIKMKDGYPIRIRDVAEIKIGAAPKIGDGSYNAQSAIVLIITKQPGINSMKLTESIDNSLLETAKLIPADIQIHTDIFEQAGFILTAINNVKLALFEGGIFVFIILFIFLLNYRTTLISVLAIPLSLLIAVISLKILGISINTMTLGGMTIAIGSLVDDAIIDVENVYKRLRQNVQLPDSEKKHYLKVIFDASVEIRSSIMNATLIIIVAFIPLFFLSGMEGRMLKPLGIAYIISLLASLLVALTIVPVLSSYLLKDEKQLLKFKEGSRVEIFLSLHYQRSLNYMMNKKKSVLITAAVLFIFSVILLGTFGRSFLPPFNEGSLTINTATVPGLSLEESNKIGKKAEELLLTMPEISSMARRTGRAELAEHAFGVNVSEIDAPFELNGRSRQEFVAEVREKLNSIPGAMIEVGQPISHRIDAMLSGSKANIAIKLFGTDLNQMFRIANEISVEIANVEGIADLTVEQQVEIPQIKIVPRREMLARYGIPVNHFLEFVSFAFGGEKISEVFENEKSFNLVLRYADQSRDNIDALKNALIDTKDGLKVPLHYVADIKSVTGPNTINRENVMRKIVVSVNVAERDVRSVVNDIQDIVESNIELPENYRIEYGGQFESEASASRILLLASLGSILLIFMLLYVEFKNSRQAGIILLNLPLAMIGGVIAIAFTSATISIPAIIGFITLFGIATRNGILLVSRYNALEEEGLNTYDRTITGSSDRLNPILMTALTAALALIPLAIAGDKPGNEIQSPMAVVILGGLLSSTFLNIYVVPLVYHHFNLKKSEK